MTKQKSEEFDLAAKLAQLEKIEQYFQQAPTDPMQAIAKHKEAVQLATEIKQYLGEAETELKKVEVGE